MQHDAPEEVFAAAKATAKGDAKFLVESIAEFFPQNKLYIHKNEFDFRKNEKLKKTFRSWGFFPDEKQQADFTASTYSSEIQGEKERLKWQADGYTEFDAQAIQKARAFGDLSENSEYDEAKNEQAEIESRIAQLEAMLKTASIIEDDQIRTDVISVGCKVRLLDNKTDDEYEYTIVGPTESDPFNDLISDESPIGKALIGARVGDLVQVETPVGVSKYSVISISKM